MSITPEMPRNTIANSARKRFPSPRRLRSRRTQESSNIPLRPMGSVLSLATSEPSHDQTTRQAAQRKQNYLLPPLESKANDRAQHPEVYPDLDFHHSFGAFLTRKNPVSSTVDPQIAYYWDLLSNTPWLLQHYINPIVKAYRGAFRDLFTADPISLHGHVSDASNAALLTSLISHLISHASPRRKIYFFAEGDKLNPRVAIVEGSYGAGYGCLAYDAVVIPVRRLANGPRPVIIKTINPARIDASVQNAKKQGCIALIAEIVRAKDGKVIGEQVWASLLAACERHKLILVVDEALTAIRCGASFACQLPQYSQHGLPDLILFGKGVRTNGVAVEWRGINIQKLGINDAEDRLFTILEWQERLTEMAQAADLLTSWGTLVLAKRENWPVRAQEVGRVLRNILISEGTDDAHISGLHSLIYIRNRDIARLKWPVMGAKAGAYIRWLPVLDEVMGSEAELRRKVFGPESIAHRRELSAWLKAEGLKMGFCSRCGNAVEEDVESCEVCVVRVCEACEVGLHLCPIQRLGSAVS